MSDIVRDTNQLLEYYEELNYPGIRYTKEIFEVYEKISLKRNEYEMLLKGINYETKRKIKIGGKLYLKLFEKFYIKDGYDDKIIFTELDNIDKDSYIKETKKEVNNIKKLNKPIILRNKQIDEVLNKINKLENWDDFIEFENIKYGIPEIKNNIHYENNCMGNMKKIYVTKGEYTMCTCKSCENWFGCKEPVIWNGVEDVYYYICEKCEKRYDRL